MSLTNNCICLDGAWQLFYEENYKCAETADLITDIAALKKTDYKCITGNVPGNFELDMHKAGLLPDLFRGKNALIARNLENIHLWYATELEVRDTIGEWYFDFEGIDTFAKIYLNGKEIGCADNMLISHKFKAVGLRQGKNELIVHIIPTALEARKSIIGAGAFVYQSYNADSLNIRKAPHMFGWDIMPRILSGGLWRSVYLYRQLDDRIEDIYVATAEAGKEYGSFHLYYKTAISRDRIEGYTLKISGQCRDSRFDTEIDLWHTEGKTLLGVDNPYLWWPKSMGAPDLYKIEISLCFNGILCDKYTVNAGMRVVKLEKTDYVENGEGEFCFYVNGERMFVRGTNWVPLDAFHSRDRERLPKVLELLDETNCNMVRCWGGNVYEDHAFFDFCDSRGIAVWQDFSMACAAYPQTAEFAEKIKKEAENIVSKLRNHPSVFMWAGDNECDEAISCWYKLGTDPNTNILTRSVLPQVIRNNDPFRAYLPSSPYISPLAYSNGKSGSTPEKHLWGPRRYFKADYYSKAVCRFASEIGYHGCPEPDSVKEFINGDNIWPWQDNEEWLVHATCMELKSGANYSGRIALMANQIGDLFGADKKINTLEEFSLASQITQAEAYKYFIEKFRLGKWEKHTGILWWNLIDGWPQFSDSVVDYYYRKKLAYHVIKNSQQTVTLMMREPENGRLILAASNDSLEEVSLTYSVTDAESGEALLSGSAAVAANLTADIGEIPCGRAETSFYIIEWEIDRKTYKNHYLYGNAPVSYETCLNGYKKLGFIEI